MPIHDTHDHEGGAVRGGGGERRAAGSRTLASDVETPDMTAFEAALRPGVSPAMYTPQVLHYLQRTAGNASVADALGALRDEHAPRSDARSSSVPRTVSRVTRSSPLAQRHAAGAAPSYDTQAVGAEVAGRTAPGKGAGGGPAPASTPAPAAGPTPTPAGAPGGTGPAATGAGPAPAAPVSNKAMDYATAEAAVSGAYGKVKKIVPAPIKIVSKKELLDAYDNDCIKRGVKFTEADGTKRPWKKGDASSNIEGFAMVDGSAIYVQKDTVLPTATAHELLHVNTAGGFRGAVGEAINEGTTEYLAKKAVAAAGLPTVGPTGAKAYPGQVEQVEKLIRIVGEAALTEAYFSGAETLIRAYEAIMPHTFAELKGTGSLSVAHMAKLLVPRTPAQKSATVIGRLLLGPFFSMRDIAIINAVADSDPADVAAIRATVAPFVETTFRFLLAGQPSIHLIKALAASPVVDAGSHAAALGPFVTAAAGRYLDGWVSDGDLDAIEALRGLPIADPAGMRAVLRPRALELWSIGQRTRLRIILDR